MRPRVVRIIAALATLVGVLACGGADGIAPTTSTIPRASDSTLLAGLSVSGPVANAGIGPNRGAVNASVAPSAEVSYVSLVPGTVADGTTATIANLRTALRVTVTLVEGGFDPQPIPASLGDTLQVTVSRTGAMEAAAYMAVADRRGPRIVRSRPPRGQTDAPLNTIITLVFSEPLDPASVTPTSVTLSAGGLPIAGAVRVLAGPGYTVEFTPSVSLMPATTYMLTVSSAVTNLAGTALATPASLTFTTGTSLTSDFAATVTVSPDPATMNAGEQIRLAVRANATGQIVAMPYQSVRWTSSIPDVAVVDPWSGLVRAIGAGTAVITATNAYIGDFGTARITVNPATTPIGAIATSGCADRWGDVYYGVCGLFAVDPDGSNGRFLTGSGDDNTPAWSPDGTSIAFRSQRGCNRTTTPICHHDLYVMQADGSGTRGDGSGLRSLTTGSGLDVGGMSWSPDGSRIVFAGAVLPLQLCCSPEALYVINADGSGLHLLISGPPGRSASLPDWSPDGSKIAYTVEPARTNFMLTPRFPPDEFSYSWNDTTTIHVVHADGSNDVGISTPSASSGDFAPKWSPDGKRISFTRWWFDSDTFGGLYQAFVMNADGSGVTQITNESYYAWASAWSPDGTRLALYSWGLGGLSVMNSDGSGGTRLVCCDSVSFNVSFPLSAPSWRRTPVATSVPAQSRARP